MQDSLLSCLSLVDFLQLLLEPLLFVVGFDTVIIRVKSVVEVVNLVLLQLLVADVLAYRFRVVDSQ